MFKFIASTIASVVDYTFSIVTLVALVFILFMRFQLRRLETLVKYGTEGHELLCTYTAAVEAQRQLMEKAHQELDYALAENLVHGMAARIIVTRVKEGLSVAK